MCTVKNQNPDMSACQVRAEKGTWDATSFVTGIKVFRVTGCLHHHPFLIFKLLELIQTLLTRLLHLLSSLLRLSGSCKEDRFFPYATCLITGALGFGSQDQLSRPFFSKPHFFMDTMYKEISNGSFLPPLFPWKNSEMVIHTLTHMHIHTPHIYSSYFCHCYM